MKYCVYDFNRDERIVAHVVGRNPFKWVNKENTIDEILFYIQQEDAKQENVLNDNEEIEGVECNKEASRSKPKVQGIVNEVEVVYISSVDTRECKQVMLAAIFLTEIEFEKQNRFCNAFVLCTNSSKDESRYFIKWIGKPWRRK